MKTIAVVAVAAATAFGLPLAFAEAVNATGGADPFGGWGGVLSSTPLTAGLLYVFREMMAANRAREIDQVAREKANQEHEQRVEAMRSEAAKENAAAQRELAEAVRVWSARCYGVNEHRLHKDA